MNLPKIAPDASVDIKVQGADSSKGGLFCVDVKATVVGSAVGPLEEPKLASSLPIALSRPAAAAKPMVNDQWTAKWHTHAPDAKNVQLKWSDCSGGNMHVKNVDVNFNGGKAVTLGEPLSVIANGDVDESVTGGQYTFSAKAGFIPVAKHTDTVCGTTFFNVLAIGKVTVHGVDCAGTKAGPVKIEIDMNLPKIAPDASVDIKVQGADSSKGGLFCVDVKATVVGAAVGPLEEPKPLKSLPVSWEVVPRVGCLKAGKCCLDCRGDCCSHEWHTTLKCGSLHRCD